MSKNWKKSKYHHHNDMGISLLAISYMPRAAISVPLSARPGDITRVRMANAHF